MNELLRDRLLAAFELTPDQRTAAVERNKDVAVTAGAGSGKTSTLVARYASLLADGIDLRRVVAITFTDKAAREMRSRVRETLEKLVQQAPSVEERETWGAMTSRMDAARIGTIHSLCAEILRAHPVEAVVDPLFEIIDEGLQKTLLLQIVDDTMATLVGMPEFEPLLRIMETGTLSRLLVFLLEKRLDAQDAFNANIPVSEVISRELKALIETPELAECIAELREMRKTAHYREDGSRLAPQVDDLLALWSKAEIALSTADPVACAGFLNMARREKMNLTSLKGYPQEKEIVRDLANNYDNLLNPICGGKTKNEVAPNAQTEAEFNIALKLIKQAFGMLTDSYRLALRERGVLDFDDLEEGAAKLMKNPVIREQWQGQIDALMVDEFQDTNKRQLDIIQALAGSNGRLFVVGDAKQSIYRFRRADVTVFRNIQVQTRTRDGLSIDLDVTFRAHEPLIDGMGDLLSETMGTQEEPARPYYVPFTPMTAFRKIPKERIRQPHIEFVYGTGKNAKKARPNAAKALAERLLELKLQKQIDDWDDVTLLFRAASGFPAYENAFEDANIPFVTVAGRGFYDRAEIRDVLNILRAVADPADDLAMAGLLRSPAFGLTDTALYQLRQQSQPPVHYWMALQDDLSILRADDRLRAIRALSLLERLLPLVDRVPVAELLKRLVDETDYRSILAIGDHSGAGGRLWRNLDKLIGDARDSGIVNVRDFLDYLNAINDAGAREGEAPAEAQGSVRLMTIHKAKGLQYPIVVLADASHADYNKLDPAYLQPELGLAFKLDLEPLLYRLEKKLDKMQNEAETQRVLYVALTRAQEKLIISGHATSTNKQGWKAVAWMEALGNAAGVDVNAVVEQAGLECIIQTACGQLLRAWALSAEDGGSRSNETDKSTEFPVSKEVPIYEPLVEGISPIIAADETNEVRYWRATGFAEAIPHGVIGTMVHKAIELWLFPENPKFISLLETTAQNAGLAMKSQRDRAVKQATELVTRFYDHPLRREIESSLENYQELPYSRMVGDHAETGYIDVLFRTDTGWQILDFKTDHITSIIQKNELMELYCPQIQRYRTAINTLLNIDARSFICFLDDQGKVEVEEM